MTSRAPQVVILKAPKQYRADQPTNLVINAFLSAKFSSSSRSAQRAAMTGMAAVNLASSGRSSSRGTMTGTALIHLSSSPRIAQRNSAMTGNAPTHLASSGRYLQRNTAGIGAGTTVITGASFSKAEIILSNAAPTVGRQLTGTAASWLNTPVTSTWQWNRGGTPIPGATSLNYTPVTADVGFTLTLTETALNSGGYVSATSLPTNPVVSGLSLAPVNTALPIVTGLGQFGQTLTASPGTWTNSPTITYQWFRNASAIAGQTANTYTLGVSDIGQTVTIQVTATNGASSAAAQSVIPQFGIYSSTLGGGATSILDQSTFQEQNHANPSPDGNWLAFTTYNHVVGGLAQESGGALNTEIRLINLTTGAITSAIPPNASFENAWPSWWPDSASFVYKTTQGTSGGHEAIWRYSLTSGASSFYDPGDINISSSNVNSAGDIVFAGTTPVTGGFQGYLYTLVGGVRTQLTNPPITAGVTLGDSAPSWSPDKTKVACLRQYSLGLFQIVVISVSAGPAYTNTNELVITPSGSAKAVDGIPQWSSDGTKIVFYHIDPANVAANGIYTMNADGSVRTQVTGLPAEFSFTDTVNFAPGGGSSSSAPIYFSGQARTVIDTVPVNTVSPIISGIAQIGQPALTATTGTWTANSGIAYSYQWNRSGAAIGGATSASYSPVAADVGSMLTVTVTATNSGGYASVTSAATAPTSATAASNSTAYFLLLNA